MLSATSLWIANGPLISDRKIWPQICFPEFASYKTDRTFNRSAERWILLSNRVATSNSLAFRQSTRKRERLVSENCGRSVESAIIIFWLSLVTRQMTLFRDYLP